MKRQREQARREKAAAKAEKRAQKKAGEKGGGPEIIPDEPFDDDTPPQEG